MAIVGDKIAGIGRNSRIEKLVVAGIGSDCVPLVVNGYEMSVRCFIHQ